MEDINTPIGDRGSVPGFILAIIIVLIAVGAGYFLFTQSSDTYPEKDDIAEMLKIQSGSDDIDSIEADLNATDIDSL
jgi:hypothetical protein